MEWDPAERVELVIAGEMLVVKYLHKMKLLVKNWKTGENILVSTHWIITVTIHSNDY